MSLKNWASCLVPNINSQLPFYCLQPSFGFKQFFMVECSCATTSNVFCYCSFYHNFVNNQCSTKTIHSDQYSGPSRSYTGHAMAQGLEPGSYHYSLV